MHQSPVMPQLQPQAQLQRLSGRGDDADSEERKKANALNKKSVAGSEKRNQTNYSALALEQARNQINDAAAAASHASAAAAGADADTSCGSAAASQSDKGDSQLTDGSATSLRDCQCRRCSGCLLRSRRS